MVKQGPGRLEGRLGHQRNQIVDSEVSVDRLVETADALGGDQPAAGVRIDHHGVARGDHVDGIAGDGRQRVGDWRDGPNHSEWGMLDHGQPVVAAEDFARHELNSGYPIAEHLELFDLVVESADAGFFIFQLPELFCVLDGNPADVGDGPLATLHAELLELLKGLAGGGHCLIDRGKDTVATSAAGAGNGASSGPQLGDHLADDGVDIGVGWLAHG